MLLYRNQWQGKWAWPAVSPPAFLSAETFDRRQGHGKVWVPRGSALSVAAALHAPQTAITHSGVRRYAPGWHGRTTWWIDCRRDGEAWNNGAAQAATVAEDTLRRDGDTTMLTSVATKSLPVQFSSSSAAALSSLRGYFWRRLECFPTSN